MAKNHKLAQAPMFTKNSDQIEWKLQWALKNQHITALYLITFAVILRLLPHPANFAQLRCIYFGGAILPDMLSWVPLAAMMASDMVLGFHKLIPVTWGCYLLIALASSTWLKKPRLAKGAFLTVSASVFFFVVTNFAVWVQGSLYAHNWAGLSQCYTMALPFFRNTLLSIWFTPPASLRFTHLPGN